MNETEIKMGVIAQLVTITPVMAREMLLRNTGNRAVRRSVVTRYATDICAGRWHVGTSVIVVDYNGVVLDGQHRLLACIEASMPFTTLLAEGVDPAARLGIDQGARRTLSDVLTWQGHKQATQLAAAVRHGWLWSRGSPLDRSCSPSHDEALAWLQRNPSVAAEITLGCRMYRALGMPASVAAVMAHRLRLIESSDSDEFLLQVEHGENLRNGMPALTLRNWLGSQVISPRTSRRPLPGIYHSMFIKAWNGYVGGREVKQLKFIAREPFPVLLDAAGVEASLADEVDLRVLPQRDMSLVR